MSIQIIESKTAIESRWRGSESRQNQILAVGRKPMVNGESNNWASV